jgi:hypothetical protein
MPKKLAQLVKDVNDIATGYQQQMSELLRIKDDLPKHSSKVLGDQQDKLKRRIDDLKTKGQKGNTVGQFYNDPAAKRLIDDLDDHKKQLRQLFSDYWKVRSKLSNIADSTRTVLRRTDAIIADKQNQWFSSGSLTAIKTHRKYLDALYNHLIAIVIDLEPLPKPGEGGLPSLEPGATKDISINALTERYKVPKIDKFLDYFNKGGAAEVKRQTAAVRATVEEMAQTARENPEI